MGKQKCCDGSDCVRESNSSGWNLPDNAEITALQKQNFDSNAQKCKHNKCVFVLMRTTAQDPLVSSTPHFPGPRSSAASAVNLKSPIPRQSQMNMGWRRGLDGSTICPAGLLEGVGGGGWIKAECVILAKILILAQFC